MVKRTATRWFPTVLSALAAAVLMMSGGSVLAADEEAPTKIKLYEHNGYFEAEDTLMGMKSGEYIIEVKNVADKLCGLEVQDSETGEVLAKGPIKPGQTKQFSFEATDNGFKYRCPINPTPWYEVQVKTRK